MAIDLLINPAPGQVNSKINEVITTFENNFSAISTELNTKENSKLQFNDVVVQASYFTSDSTYSTYSYRAPIALTNVEVSMIPEVILGCDDAVSGIFAPVSECYAGGVYIYSTQVPNNDMTVPTINCWEGGL